ncbi:hypothetical protein [Tropicibacter sp. S64]|uniref:hypothetical protein n=1 Tax=Tropicibacter sp. S64 TaxID=3415122 RepID=UPI003C7BC300
MKRFGTWLMVVSFALAACTEGGPYPPSKTPAPQSAIAEAERTAALCARNAPNGAAAIAALKASGFTPASNPDIEAVKNGLTGTQRLGYLENTEQGIIVLIRSASAKQSSFFCSISVRDMTVAQGAQVADIWVRKYRATDKTLFKDAPLKNEVMGWQAIADRSYTQIGISPSTSHPGGPGATIVLRFATKDAGAPVSSGSYTITKTR